MDTFPPSRNLSSPFPLGANPKEGGVNFSIFSDYASSVTLLLYLNNAEPQYYSLQPSETEIGKVWHTWVKDIPNNTQYLYQIDGPNTPKEGLIFDKQRFVIDPYAKSLASPFKWGLLQKKSPFPVRAEVVYNTEFDWQGIEPPNHPKKDLLIYEMHVRGFTKDESSEVEQKGTFLGIIEKIPYLKSLGITALELMPIFEFDENANPRTNPDGCKLFNFWGYTSANFFTPMKRYAADVTDSVITQFKTLVKELHRNGIELILDVVYNHVVSSHSENPYPSFHAADQKSYYLLDNKGHHTNYTGCGNTMNCNHPAMKKLIIDSLVYWSTEMHVDGFRFDLASILTRDQEGKPLDPSPLIKEIAKHPKLSKLKLIMEPWDAAGLYQLGQFAKWGPYAEWNGAYRDAVRRFIKGDANSASLFASAITGSQQIYSSTTPTSSVNFVTCHDGYSLYDLVSYEQKHNLENGELNRDGCNNNDSWNCGKEGNSDDIATKKLRERQVQNFLVALFISRGIPMIYMGDEYGHTKQGNNNTWCLDNKKNYFMWNKLKENENRYHFLSALIRLRNKYPILKKETFYDNNQIEWHGLLPNEMNWEEDRRYIACSIKDTKECIYIAFNTSADTLLFRLPQLESAKKWYRVLDTSLDHPENILDETKGHTPVVDTYELPSYSSIILVGK